MKGPARAGVVVSSFVLSSALIHAAVMRPGPLLQWLALVSIALVPLCLPLLALRWRAWLALLVLAAAFAGLVHWGGGVVLLFLPSVAIPAMLAWFFGRTLRAGREPLIASVALAARPATPDYLLRYSRSLTVFWTALFVAIAAWDLALAALAPHAAWSAMANCGNYLVIGAAVGGEYLFRRLRFRDYAHPGFAEYLRIVVRAGQRRTTHP